MHSLQMTII